MVCFLLAETPIEEFTPTPAFPALQYLESVDVEGVAWRAGLRTGDFLIEVIKDSSSFHSICFYVIVIMMNRLVITLNKKWHILNSPMVHLHIKKKGTKRIC